MGSQSDQYVLIEFGCVTRLYSYLTGEMGVLGTGRFSIEDPGGTLLLVGESCGATVKKPLAEIMKKEVIEHDGVSSVRDRQNQDAQPKPLSELRDTPPNLVK